MEKQRWLTFILIVMAISFFFQAVIFKPTAPPSASKPTAPPGAEAPGRGTAEQAAESRPAEEEPEPGLPAEGAPEEPARSVVLQEDFYRIEFTSRGAVPISWQVIDPVFLPTGARGHEPSGPGRSQDRAGSRTLEMIPAIPGATDPERPFEFSIREANRAGGYLETLNRANYSVNESVTDDGEHRVEFVSPVLPQGVQLTKTYSVPRSGFVSRVSFRLTNQGAQTLHFESDGHGPGVVWAPGVGGEANGGKGFARSYSARTTAVWLSAGQTFYQGEADMAVGASREFAGQVQWAGVTNRYFLAALIPQGAAEALQVSAKPRNSPPGSVRKGSARQAIEIYGPPLILKPGESVEYVYDIFIGPKSRAILNEAGQSLDQVLFFNSWRWFRALCLFLMGALIWLRQFLPDYGYSIIALTVILRVAMQPFVQFSMKSNARFMKAQAKLKPELDEITKKHKDNPQKRNEETWKLYKKHNVNPLGMMKGCFWMMIQMPIFLAFYRLLDASIDLRGAPFLWIVDLSLPDRLFRLPLWFPLIQEFNALPILMTLTQYVSTKLSSPTSTDPTQKQMLYLMPVMFLFMMYSLSSGLVLYWFVSNVLQIGSQAIINRMVKKEGEAAKPTPTPSGSAKALSGPAAEGAEGPSRRKRRGG